MIGEEIGKMHLADVIHGDLTTSNMMVRLLFDPKLAIPTSTELWSKARFEVVCLSLFPFQLVSKV